MTGCTSGKLSLLRLPPAPPTISPGMSLRSLLDRRAVNCLADNLTLVHPAFDREGFIQRALKGIRSKQILERGIHIADALHVSLPKPYAQGIEVLLSSLTEPLAQTSGNGLGVFFYLPHTAFVARYGLDPAYNEGRSPFHISMRAQYELTQRFTAEYSIRHFILRYETQSLKLFRRWVSDESPHVRRLCSEGTRPRLPWAIRLPRYIQDPEPCLWILEALKDDPDLYVRRSVANHLGDIAKDHLDIALRIAQRWLRGANEERRWVIRHALRYPAKKGDPESVRIRAQAS